MGSHHRFIIESGYSDFHGPPYIPMKAAQWHMKQIWLNFPGLKYLDQIICETSVDVCDETRC